MGGHRGQARAERAPGAPRAHRAPPKRGTGGPHEDATRRCARRWPSTTRSSAGSPRPQARRTTARLGFGALRARATTRQLVDMLAQAGMLPSSPGAWRFARDLNALAAAVAEVAERRGLDLREILEEPDRIPGVPRALTGVAVVSAGAASSNSQGRERRSDGSQPAGESHAGRSPRRARAPTPAPARSGRLWATTWWTRW